MKTRLRILASGAVLVASLTLAFVHGAADDLLPSWTTVRPSTSSWISSGV